MTIDEKTLNHLGKVIANDPSYIDSDWTSISIVVLFDSTDHPPTDVVRVNGLVFEETGNCIPSDPTRSDTVDFLCSLRAECPNAFGNHWLSCFIQMRRNRNLVLKFMYNHPPMQESRYALR